MKLWELDKTKKYKDERGHEYYFSVAGDWINERECKSVTDCFHWVKILEREFTEIIEDAKPEIKKLYAYRKVRYIGDNKYYELDIALHTDDKSDTSLFERVPEYDIVYDD